jgi:hypothetical protein
MATIKTVIDEFQTIANAFTGVEEFMYDRPSHINGRLNEQYPLILVNSSPNHTRGDVNNSFLPRKKRFTLNVFCYDTYNEDEKSTTTLQTKQANVDELLDQYIAEVMRRNVSGSNGFYLSDQSNINGFVAHDVHNGRFVQSTYTINVYLDSECNTGTFNY